jgi:hypothetical protein
MMKKVRQSTSQFFKTVSYECNWIFWLAIIAITNLTRIQRIFQGILVVRTKPRIKNKLLKNL